MLRLLFQLVQLSAPNHISRPPLLRSALPHAVHITTIPFPASLGRPLFTAKIPTSRVRAISPITQSLYRARLAFHGAHLSFSTLPRPTFDLRQLPLISSCRSISTTSIANMPFHAEPLKPSEEIDMDLEHSVAAQKFKEIREVLEGNRYWARKVTSEEPEFMAEQVKGQVSSNYRWNLQNIGKLTHANAGSQLPLDWMRRLSGSRGYCHGS